ncbi:MAG: nicotinamide N-methylase [Mesorhizobium amorphae]|nr:MAG: nicotinamide N-methylase [Mesorhizobium amorphae]
MGRNLPHGRALTPAEAERFILANTSVLAPPHVPEIRLHLADEAHDLWLKTEDELAEIGLPPPFWAFAWAGGQGLARFVLDHPEEVKGRRVLDFASGSGLVAIAAAMAGAEQVLAADIDPFAEPALRLNAGLNGVAIAFTGEDLAGTEPQADILLAGDVFYDRALAERLLPWFSALAGRGTLILVGDPGRSYFPAERFTLLSDRQVPVSRALEDAEVKRVRVWRWKESS